MNCNCTGNKKALIAELMSNETSRTTRGYTSDYSDKTKFHIFIFLVGIFLVVTILNSRTI